MQLAEIYLEAKSFSRHCARAYRLTLTQDLFGAYVLEARYGRIGAYGHAIVRSYDNETTARGALLHALKRRKGGKARNGVAYTIRSLLGIDADTALGILT